MKIIEEFKQFAVKGNMVDLAVGVIIGGAFGKIVSSFVADVLMPPIGLLLGGVSFSSLQVTLRQATASAPAVTLNYGSFIQAAVDFLIIAGVIFLMIKLISRLKRREAAKVPEASNQEKLLAEIRDLLKQRNDR